MKKSKLLVLGLIALVLACGLVLASCGDRICNSWSSCSGDDNCGRSTCTGLPDGCKC